MWTTIYWLVLTVLILVLAAASIYGGVLAYNMIQDLLRYLESKKEMRVDVRDLGIKPKLHRPEHLKSMMKTFRLDKQKRWFKTARIEGIWTGIRFQSIILLKKTSSEFGHKTFIILFTWSRFLKTTYNSIKWFKCLYVLFKFYAAVILNT